MHAQPQSFVQQVIINGVIGWGIDSASDIDETLDAIYKVLRRR